MHLQYDTVYNPASISLMSHPTGILVQGSLHLVSQCTGDIDDVGIPIKYELSTMPYGILFLLTMVGFVHVRQCALYNRGLKL